MKEVAPLLPPKHTQQTSYHTPDLTAIAQSDLYNDLWRQKHDKLLNQDLSKDHTRSGLGRYYMFGTNMEQMHRLLPLGTPASSPVARSSCYGAEPRVRNKLPRRKLRAVTSTGVNRVSLLRGSTLTPEFAVCGQTHPELAPEYHRR